MRNRLTSAAALAALIPLATAAASTDSGPSRNPGVPPPFFQGEAGEAGSSATDGMPSGRPAFGPDGAVTGLPPVSRGVAAPPSAPPPEPPTRAETIDKLLNRLAKAGDAGEAQGIAARLQGMWMRSGSDTADLLMERAVTAMNGERRDVAAALLDEIIALQPGWAEAWNKRATLRFLDDDDAGSMEDISHVLALEPRHFGALSGMGFILQRHGEAAGALKALRRALAVYPENEDVRKAVDKLAPTVEGEDL